MGCLMKKIRFHLDKPNQNESAVLLFYSCTDKRMRYSTQLNVSTSKWDKKKMRVNARSAEDRKANTQLDYLENVANAILLSFQKESSPVKHDEFKLRLDQELGRKDFEHRDKFEALRYILTYYTKNPHRHATTPCRWFTEYAKTKKTCYFEDIDYLYLKGFHEWLVANTNVASSNTITTYFAFIKTPLAQAFKEGLHDSQRYKTYSVGIPKTESIYLTESEIERFQQLPLPLGSTQDLVRDIFVIGAFTGLRVSDYTSIKLSNVKTIEGIDMLHIKQKKTKQDVYIPMRPTVMKLLEKYNYEIPSISTRAINKNLKMIAALTGLNDEVEILSGNGIKVGPKHKFVSSHTARRSFATNAYLAGVPMLAIMKITGHRTQTSFMRYICADSLTNAIHIADHGFFKDFRDRASNILSIKRA